MRRLVLLSILFAALYGCTPPAAAVTITVPANPLWTETGIVLTPKVTAAIHGATGAWNWGVVDPFFGPNGDLRPDLTFDEWIANGRHGQLIGFIGSNPYAASQNDPRLFAIGSGTVTVTGKSGKLWLGFNDDFSTGSVGDNAGSVSVQVEATGEPNSARLVVVGGSDQVRLSPGQCVTLSLQVRFAGGSAYVDVSHEPTTTFLVDALHGSFSGSVFCAGPNSANSAFTLYGRYQDPRTGVGVSGTLAVRVIRGQPLQRSLTVPATQDLPGVDTGVDLGIGSYLQIRANGTAIYGQDVSCGLFGFVMTDPNGRRNLSGVLCPPKFDPAAVLPSAPIGALIGRIGAGPWFFVGSELNTAVYQKGRLFLLYNDDSGLYQDNGGGFSVAITVN